MENVMLEKRVCNMESIIGKLSVVTQQNTTGQAILTEVIEELTNSIGNNIATQVDEQLNGMAIEVNGKISGIEGEVGKIKEVIKNDEITGTQASEIENERRRRVVHLLGGLKSDKYLVFSSAYFSSIGHDIKSEFSLGEKPLSAFKHIRKNQYDDVIEFIHSWKPNENKIKHRVIANMLILRDKTEDMENMINEGNLTEAQKYNKAIEINKNKKKLDIFNRYMNKEAEVI